MDGLKSDLAAEVERVADRLRTLSQARLRAAVPGHPSRAAAARATAQVLADAAAVIEADRIEAGRPTPAGQGARALPELSEFASGDQVAVTGHDLIAALDAAPPDSYADLAADALDRLRVLRRLL